jgi:hypothetical protein
MGFLDVLRRALVVPGALRLLTGISLLVNVNLAFALDEYAVMAAYTHNFAKFTRWPADSFSTPDAPLNLCVLGEDPFGMALDQMEDRSIGKHPLKIRRYPRVAVVTNCHILFISRSEEWRLEVILKDLESLPILTVSDIADFCQRGGMIKLDVIDQRVRFSINLQAVVQARLKLSSKLLELAQLISNRSGSEP